ncbi:MAG: insulinase family protein, partial [Croceitalea sp.]|nr:insulinase family protein [Croceitalea sp.]
MKYVIKMLLLTVAILLISSCNENNKDNSATSSEFKVPVEYYTLDNGLKVILSPDQTSPTAIVAVYY